MVADVLDNGARVRVRLGRVACFGTVGLLLLTTRCSRPHTGDLGEACNENLHNLFCNGDLVCENDVCVVNRHAVPAVTGCTFSTSGCPDAARGYQCTDGTSPTTGPSPPEGVASTCEDLGKGFFCCRTRDAG